MKEVRHEVSVVASVVSLTLHPITVLYEVLEFA